jgi:hypothetical protein
LAVLNHALMAAMRLRNSAGVRAALLLSIGGALASGTLYAVEGNGSPAPQAGAAPTNLQVLPHDIGSSELSQRMYGFNRALGVQCDYCHAQGADPDHPDYASDENPRKLTARLMLRMLDDINGKFIAQLGDARYVDQVECGTCHRGHSEPPSFEPAPGAGGSDK